MQLKEIRYAAYKTIEIVIKTIYIQYMCFMLCMLYDYRDIDIHYDPLESRRSPISDDSMSLYSAYNIFTYIHLIITVYLLIYYHAVYLYMYIYT